MESETELITLVNLRTISTRLRISIEDIKHNHPSRTDLIIPMQQSEIDLNIGIAELQNTYYDRKQYREQAEMLSRYNMQLQEEIRNLRILVDRLTEDAKM